MVAAVFLCALLAACGSTVQIGGTQAGVAPGASELALDDGMTLGGTGGGKPGTTTAPGGGQVAPGGGVVGGGTPGAGGAAAPGTSGTGAGTAGPGTSTGGNTPGTTDDGSGRTGNEGSRPANEPGGASATTIKIGLEYASDTKEANAALGAGGVTQADAKANYETLIKYYNARGGFDGRKIEPVYFEYSAFRDIEQQQTDGACPKFTKDDPVFAVFALDATEGYVNCLTSAGVGVWGFEPLTAADDDMFASYPSLVMPSALSLTHAARLYAPGLRQAGFFKPEAIDKSTTIGLVTFDESRYKDAAQEFKASLAAVGEDLDQEAYVHYAKSQGEAGQLSADVSAAVLKFNREGVDHVTIIEESALVAFTFQQAAERQGYKPQYGFNSTSGGQLFIDSGLSEPNQMIGSVLVGWMPSFDVPPRYAPSWPAQKECLKMYERAGIHTTGNARGVSILHCAGFDFMHHALAAAPGAPTVNSIALGAERLGTSWESPWSMKTNFAPDRHYGTALYLTAAYDQGCKCFKPQGNLRPIPD
jgi:hypothetical protein